jgi:hypothetical protein
VYSVMDELTTQAKDALQATSSGRSSTSALLRIQAAASLQAEHTSKRCVVALNADLASTGSVAIEATGESQALADGQGRVATTSIARTSIGAGQTAARRQLLAAESQASSRRIDAGADSGSKMSWSAAKAIKRTAAPVRQIGQGNEVLGGVLLFQVGSSNFCGLHVSNDMLLTASSALQFAALCSARL